MPMAEGMEKENSNVSTQKERKAWGGKASNMKRQWKREAEKPPKPAN